MPRPTITGMKPRPAGPDGVGKATNLSGSLAEGIDEPGDVIKGDPHLAGQQRLLHELVVDRLGMHGRPQLIAGKVNSSSAPALRNSETMPPVYEGQR